MTSSDALVALTNFGDLAVLLPLAVVVAIWLAHASGRRDALWWAAAAAFCTGTTALLKVAFFVCPPVETLQSPSGHTSFSVLVYGALGLFVAAQTDGWRRIVAILGTGSAVVVIAASRVLLSNHSWIEAIVGLMIGAGALALMATRYRPAPRRDMPLRVLFLAVALILAVFHGRQLHAESLLRAIGVELKAGGISCR